MEIITISRQLEKIADDICDNYCKFSDEFNKSSNADEEEIFEKHCNNCPLNKI